MKASGIAKNFFWEGRNLPEGGGPEFRNRKFFAPKKLFTLDTTQENVYFSNVRMEPGGYRPLLATPLREL